MVALLSTKNFESAILHRRTIDAHSCITLTLTPIHTHIPPPGLAKLGSVCDGPCWRGDFKLAAPG